MSQAGSGRRGNLVVGQKASAVKAALSVMAEGGNAVDGAVALGFAAGVVTPWRTSIGGSGFMLYHDPTRGSWSIEFPSRAPLAARPDMYQVVDDADSEGLLGVDVVHADANAIGPLSVGVPAAVAGYCLAHRRFGRLPLERVLEPALRLAADGFEVDAEFTLAALSNLSSLRANRDAAAVFLTEDGLPLARSFGDSRGGPVVRQPDLARTIEMIAQSGAAAFYQGEIAAAIVDGLRALGGIMTLDDLGRYQATVNPPLHVTSHGFELLVPTGPTGGCTVLQLLRTLQPLTVAGRDPQSAGWLHLTIEASRHVFADRYYYIGDPDHVRVPMDELLSLEYADYLAAQIGPDRIGLAFHDYPDEPWRVFAVSPAHDPWAAWDAAGNRRIDPGHTATGLADSPDTTHFCIIDDSGAMVSCTTTVADSFGSKVIAPGTGVLLDDAMLWFNARPGAANSIGPGRRPLVNMAPLIALGPGPTTIAVGAPGGRRIINAVAQVVLNLVDGRMGVQEACSTPRIDASGRLVLANCRLPQRTRDQLSAQGHPIVEVDPASNPFGADLAAPVAAMIDSRGSITGGVDVLASGGTVDGFS